MGIFITENGFFKSYKYHNTIACDMLLKARTRKRLKLALQCARSSEEYVKGTSQDSDDLSRMRDMETSESSLSMKNLKPPFTVVWPKAFLNSSSVGVESRQVALFLHFRLSFKFSNHVSECLPCAATNQPLFCPVFEMFVRETSLEATPTS